MTEQTLPLNITETPLTEVLQVWYDLYSIAKFSFKEIVIND